MSENISFESFRQKSFIDKLLAKTSKDIKLQERLHEIYNLNSVNNYKLFLCSLFYENHEILQGKNPRGGFLIGFDSDRINGLISEVINTLKSLGREYILIDANGKTFHQSIQHISGRKKDPLYNPFKDLKEILLNSNKVVIFKEISKCKSRINKLTLVRSIVKTIDDSHCEDRKPLSDILFVDYADCLQKSWKHISSYVKVTM
jgi:hypothetical protein